MKTGGNYLLQDHGCMVSYKHAIQNNSRAFECDLQCVSRHCHEGAKLLNLASLMFVLNGLP